MISCKPIGGLGNQLFIVAAGYAIARDAGEEFCIDTSDWYASQGEHPETYKDTVFKNFTFSKGDPIPKGYYQSLDYFEKYKDEFIERLNLPNYTGMETAIHIRRGDYLKYPKHQVCTDEYYEKAIKMSEPRYVIFTDDREYCEQKYRNREGFLINCSPPHLALAYMACFDTVICSNSSFSWWASLIGNCKTIVPDRWYADRICEDIYRPEMIKIKT